MPDIYSQVAGAALGGIGMGIQRVGVSYDYRKQRMQQQRLNDMQIAHDDRALRQQQEYQLEMWEKTGYGAQKDQMKRAGINPALMYGMGGGGGQTVGAGAPAAGAPKADNPNTSGSTAAMMGMGIQSAAQIALLEAQKENIEADTANKKADLPVKGATTPNIEADTANKKAQLGEIQARAQNIAEDTIKKVQEVEALVIQNKINKTTADDQIKRIKAEAIGAVLENSLTREKTKLTTEQTAEVTRRIINAYQENERAWQELSLEERRVKVAEALKDIVEEYQWTIPLGAGLDVIDKIMRNSPAGKAKQITGFGRKP